MGICSRKWSGLGSSHKFVTGSSCFILMSLTKVTIYTDGACSGNPGPGGWGAIIVYSNGEKNSISGFESQTTNNRMELSAALHALKKIQEPSEITIITDSKYLKDGMSLWIMNWQKNNWRTSSGKAVENKEIWMELLAASERHNIEYKWVKGHSGDVMNDTVDKLARDEIKRNAY